MRNGILRDVLFACAGVLMVGAVIGLPRQGVTVHQQWQVPFQNTHLLPCYSQDPKPPTWGPGKGGSACQNP
jgi:hypothetical protein